MSESKRRPAGAGSIETRKTAKGLRFRVRMPVANGGRPIVGTFDTIEEAERRADAAAVVLADGEMAAVGGITLRAFGEQSFDRRELVGEYRDLPNERNMFANHIAVSSIGGRPIAALSKRSIKDWYYDELRRKTIQHTRVDKKTGKRVPVKHPKNGERIAKVTADKVLRLLKRILNEAVDDDIISVSPAASFKVKREARTDEPWTYLDLDEQRRLYTCEKIPEHDRLLITIAETTAVRPSEMAHLRLKDVHLEAEDPHVVIRFSRKGKATKSGNIRRVSLLPGVGLDAFRRWLEILPTYCPENPLGLAFPYPSGAKRQVGGSKFFHAKKNLWREYLNAAGIEREVRFYDLRHTSASSLVSGLWGRRWSLEEIKEHLGHSTITMAQRYAHLGETTLKRAARDTRVDFAPTKSRGGPVRPQVSEDPGGPSALLIRRSWDRAPLGPPPGRTPSRSRGRLLTTPLASVRARVDARASGP